MTAIDASGAWSDGPGAGAEVTDRIVVWPQRSLSRNGRLMLLGVVAGAFTCFAGWALLVGAWPITLYTAIALAGFAFALSSNTRAARKAEIIELCPNLVRVRDVAPGRAETVRAEFDPYWLRVIDCPDPVAENRLLLRQSGRAVAIGQFLTADERRELARELRARIAERYTKLR